MTDTLKDVLPPPPHEVLKEGVNEAKGVLDAARDDAKSIFMDIAPHNLLQDLKPSKDMLPPAPPKPPRPPSLKD